MCSFKPDPDEDEYLWCHAWVDPEYRLQGIYRELWKERLDWTMAQDPEGIEGWCWAANKHMLIEAGFEEIEVDGDETLMRHNCGNDSIVHYERHATPENLINDFPQAPKNIFQTNRNCVWFVYHTKGRPVGVCAAEINVDGDGWTYRSAYIIPEFRDKGVYDELCEIRDEYINNFHVGSKVMQYPETWFVGGEFTGTRRDNLLVGFWPTPETNEHNWTVQEQHLRAIACTYGTQLQIVTKPSQIIVEDKRPWISIEETAGVRYDEFEYPEKAVYLVGNSDWRHMSEIFEVDHIINVPTPGGYEHPLYGNQVAAIVFQQRYLQRQEAGYEE